MNCDSIIVEFVILFCACGLYRSRGFVRDDLCYVECFNVDPQAVDGKDHYELQCLRECEFSMLLSLIARVVTTELLAWL